MSQLNLTSFLGTSLFFFFFLQILELVKGMHYQLACQKYFELTHNVSADFNLKRGVTWATCVTGSRSGP